MPKKQQEFSETALAKARKMLALYKKAQKKAERVHPPLPPVPQKLIDDVQEWLMTTYEMKRPPTVAAAVLAFVMILHARGEPFPMREDVAYHLGCTAWGIDAALSLALAREVLTIRIETEESTAIEQRRGVIRYRHYIPSDEMLHRFAKRPQRRVA